MSAKNRFHTLFYKAIASLLLAGIVTSCSPANLNSLEKQNTKGQVAEPINTTSASCPTIDSRNWHAWIDRVAENVG